jgi:hypothetical protein
MEPAESLLKKSPLGQRDEGQLGAWNPNNHIQLVSRIENGR